MAQGPLCIYHGNCDDGFAAAWCVRLKHPDAEFYPGIYQAPPPDVRGRDVIMVDFSYKRPVMEQIIADCATLLVLDHHKTAEADLASLDGVRPGVEVVFDMDRSGAMMAFDRFCRDMPTYADTVRFMEYVQDRDLWRKALPYGDLFTIALRSYPQDFGCWDLAMRNGVESLIAEGTGIHRYYRMRVEEMKASAYRAELGGTVCWIANAPYFSASEVAGELAERDGTFGAAFLEVGAERWQYSLRSREGFDVSEIARRFGGGGHRAAAGFAVSGRPVHTYL